MYKILLPINKKSDIQGLWHNDGLLYKDNLKAYNIFNISCNNLRELLCYCKKHYTGISYSIGHLKIAVLFNDVKYHEKIENKNLLKQAEA